MNNMSNKEIAISSLSELPETASWEDIQERILFMAALEKGRQDIREGRVVPHEEVKASLSEWITG